MKLALLLALINPAVGGVLLLAACGSGGTEATTDDAIDLTTLGPNIDVATVHALQSNPNVFMLDVREPHEYEAGHIPGITLIPMGEIVSRLSEIPNDQDVVVTCRTGNRSAQIADLLREQGFTKVSIPAIIMQMHARATLGPAETFRFDPMTVTMTHPDGLAAMLSGAGEIKLHYTSPPFHQRERRDPAVRTLQTTTDVMGGSTTFTMAYMTTAFRDANPSAIFVIFITAIWPVIINTAVGIRNIPQDYRNVAAVLRLNHAEFLWRIMIPSAAPYIFTGLRIGIGLSWLAIVAAEMLIGGVGIGFFIWDAWNSSHISEIILALFYVGIIGFVLDRLIAGLGKIVTRGTSAG